MAPVNDSELPDEDALDEHTVTITTVAAPPEACFAVGADLESYPEWVTEIRSAEVMERNSEGFPSVVKFEAHSMGRTSRYVLQYNYSQAPQQIGWSLLEGDLTRKLEGSYQFKKVVTEGQPDVDLTEVTYSLSISLAMPLPGYVKRRAEQKIVESALQRFRRRVEESVS